MRRILDDELSDKKRQLEAADRENGDSIKSELTNLSGKGKYATIEKENEELRAENEQSFPEVLKREVGKRTEKLSDEKRKAEAERQTLAKQRDEAIRLPDDQKADEQQRIDRAVRNATEKQAKITESLNCEFRWKSALPDASAYLSYRPDDVFRHAVAAIIDFDTSQCKSIFSPSETANTEEVMRLYSGEDIEQQNAIGRWLVGYAESREQLDSVELKHTYREAGDIAQGAYDSKEICREHKDE